jgi:hypothetical protein
VQNVDGFRWNGDPLDPDWKRFRDAGWQMVKDFMTQLGQSFGQNVVKKVA